MRRASLCPPPERCRPVFEEIYRKYNRRQFVHPDPLEFLYEYDDPGDREIVGLVASSLAYGRVAQILRSVSEVLDPMGPSPRRFLLASSRENFSSIYCGFRHRFSTDEELVSLLIGVRELIRTFGSLEDALATFRSETADLAEALDGWTRAIRKYGDMKKNSLLPSPGDGSACKRLFLYLRWMVRSDDVDPGGWTGIGREELVVPLDTHMFNICFSLGMTSRRQANLKAALEITGAFRSIAPEDPVRYDFALTRFGIRSELDVEDLLFRCRRMIEEDD